LRSHVSDRKPGGTVETLWRRYRRWPTEKNVMLVAEQYLPLVRLVAGRMAHGLPRHADVDSLAQDGFLGLIEAIRRFDAGRGLKFETYAGHRIRWAILDAIRERDSVPRLLRQRQRACAAATAALRERLGREPAEDELREALGLSPGEFTAFRRDAQAARTVALDRPAYTDDAARTVTEGELLADGREEPPWTRAVRSELREFLLRGLVPRERLVLLLYYVEGLSMREIGMMLEMSEPNVSVIHGAVVERLFERLRNRPDLRPDRRPP
jgi:RNA polymerase sigma factor for flagellar operon FliA